MSRIPRSAFPLLAISAALLGVAQWLCCESPRRVAHAAQTQPSSEASLAGTPPFIGEGPGRVVHLPQAAQQPRPGSKILVDITADSDRAQPHAAVEKVLRFVSIYAAAGERPADAKIAVVLHGAATCAALDDEAYAKHCRQKGNPTLAVIQSLRDAGVEFYVCGQSLAHSGYAVDEVSPQVQVAVSALTANVNLQSDGYAYVPMR